jgi:hypothetical protein
LIAVITQIADAVVEALNAGTFSWTFTARRDYLPIYELEDVKDLRVTVVPKGVAIQSSGRNSNQHDVEIDVAVQKKLAKVEAAEIDPLIALVEEIADHFRFKRLISYTSAVWIKTENEPVYAPEHLDQFRVFTSILTLTFRVIR